MEEQNWSRAGCAVFYGTTGEGGERRGQGGRGQETNNGRAGVVLTEKEVAVMGEWRKSPWVERGQGAMVPFII